MRDGTFDPENYFPYQTIILGTNVLALTIHFHELAGGFLLRRVAVNIQLARNGCVLRDSVVRSNQGCQSEKIRLHKPVAEQGEMRLDGPIPAANHYEYNKRQKRRKLGDSRAGSP